ncbi:hypothetical protein CsSME_00006115 [Camellia sinensis var. sinensis]
MATSSKLLTLCFITTLIFFSSYGVVASVDHEHQLAVGWGVLPTTSSGYRGTIAECLADDAEFGLNSEVSRRILASTRYISYSALQRHTVPCSRRGTSSYHCRSGAQGCQRCCGCSIAMGSPWLYLFQTDSSHPSLSPLMAKIIEKQVLTVAKVVEEQIDDTIHTLDRLALDDINVLRECCPQQIKKMTEKRSRWIALSHGENSEIPAEKNIVSVVKASDHVVCIFYR